mmetsp:Transcript_27010/g.67955  ORF Transcript_27010/g.67955 Transcript_27010/m.67955 type:complete len:233 (+) Transcript_27010:243-941(+)
MTVTEAATAPVAPAAAAYDVAASTNIRWHESRVSRADKEALLGQRGVVLWFTGLSGSGKSTVACTLEHMLAAEGRFTVNLDGDNVRHGLNKNLGFSAADREENIRRIGEVAKLFAESGAITLVSFISPYRADRERARALMADPADFVEVYMEVPLEVCEARDPKGLYKAARAGKIKCFTGIDDPYEAPAAAEVTLAAADDAGAPVPADAMAAEVLAYLREGGYVASPPPAAH